MFWASIHNAWDKVDGLWILEALIKVVVDSHGVPMLDNKLRPVYNKVARGVAVREIRALMPSMLDALEKQLETYSGPQIRGWHRRLFLLIEDLDRGHVEMALGTDTPVKFRHARAFVVTCGYSFFQAFSKNPECFSLGWVWPEDMLGLAMNVYKKRYGTLDYPPPTERIVNVGNPATPRPNANESGNTFATSEPSPTKTLVATPAQLDFKVHDASFFNTIEKAEGGAGITMKAVACEVEHDAECGVEEGDGEAEDEAGGW